MEPAPCCRTGHFLAGLVTGAELLQREDSLLKRNGSSGHAGSLVLKKAPIFCVRETTLIQNFHLKMQFEKKLPVMATFAAPC